MRPCAFVGVAVVILLTIHAGALRGNPGKEEEAKQIAQVIKQLGDDAYAKRQAASKELDAIGVPALAALRQAIASTDDLEIRRRAERLVQRISGRLLAVAAKKEIKGLQGAWYSTSAEYGGRRQAGEEKAARHIITADRWVNKNGEAVLQSGTLKVVEIGDKFVKIDFIVTAGFKKGDTWLAIYERKGDVLKWCGAYFGDGWARPQQLTTKPGDGYFLRTLNREKKK